VATTVRVHAVVVCDRAGTPACHGPLEVPKADLVWGAAAGRRALVARGWGPARDPDGRWRDACPAGAAGVRDAPAPLRAVPEPSTPG
jgi:hypothetical protein